MNNKRIVRWVIVLFLLAALPGLTAALAQGQEPPAKQPLPAVSELGETAVLIPWANSESEPNNTFATADVPGGPQYRSGRIVIGGTIGQWGDIDYYRLWTPVTYSDDTNHAVLIDVEAEAIGSPLDAVICLYSDDFVELACSDDTDTYDSMLYYNFESDRVHYLSVQDYDNDDGGSAYKYQILVSSPLLISAAAANLGTGNVAGIPFQSGDVLAWSSFQPQDSTTIYEKWVMFLDLSDLNVKGNLTNLAGGWRNSDYLLVGFGANLNLPGITGKVTPWDVVVFNPTQVGPVTSGVFQRWWAGKNQGLTTTAEKIDAIDWPNWSGVTRLYVSTMGAASVRGPSAATLKLADEDVGLWIGTGTPYWVNTFDGDRPSGFWWGLGKEDVIAFSRDTDLAGEDCFEEQDLIVFQGPATVWYEDENEELQTLNVTQKDIVSFEDDGCWGVGYDINVIWHGPDHGWNYNIDAIEWTPN